MKLIKLLGVCFFFLFSSRVAAQTCCTGGVPGVGSFIPVFLHKSELSLTANYTFNHNGDLISNSTVLKDSYLNRRVHSLLIQSNYGITDHLYFSLVTPFLFQSERIETNQSTNTYRNNGIGDLTSWLGYSTSRGLWKYGGALGVNFPTGSTSEIDEDTELILPLSMQNGSGSWDLAMSIYAGTFISSNRRFSIDGQIIGNLNTFGTKYQNHTDYRFGNLLQVSAVGSIHYSQAFLIGNSYIGLVSQIRGKDQFEGGFLNENTGGTWVNILAGTNTALNPKMDFGLNIILPVYRQINGLQLSTTLQASATLSILIIKNEPKLFLENETN